MDSQIQEALNYIITRIWISCTQTAEVAPGAKGACHHAWQDEFNLQSTHDRRRGSALESCPLTFTCAVTCTLSPIQINKCKFFKKKNKYLDCFRRKLLQSSLQHLTVSWFAWAANWTRSRITQKTGLCLCLRKLSRLGSSLGMSVSGHHHCTSLWARLRGILSRTVSVLCLVTFSFCTRKY